MSTRWINVVYILWLIVLRNYTMGQALYHQRYPEACRDAMEFYSEFEAELNHSASASNLEPAFLFGIVAPEVSQYNQINDYMELYALKILYSQKGTGYADFSVGFFKMKPSFIERMERFVCANESLKEKHTSILFDDPNCKSARIERLERLESIEWQIRYLCLFCEIMDVKFGQKIYPSNEAKLAFFASAFNSGFHKSEAEIVSMQSKKLFPANATQSFNYSEIARWFYNEIKG
jgi:hypothetical protein